VIAALLAAAALSGADADVPAEVRPFVLEGHRVLDYAAGDLDGDGRPDAVLVLEAPGEASGEDEGGPPRPMLLLVRRADGRLEVAKRNDRVVLCGRCGGMMGDPYQGVRIERGHFRVSHYGGSSWRWGLVREFAYDAARRDWMLERTEDEQFHAGGPDETEKVTVILREELGDVPFEGFDELHEWPEGTWRVVSERAPFYDQPDLRSKPRRAYVVKGDVVKSRRELRHFVQAEFTDAEDRTTRGFLLKRDLAPLGEPRRK
jgi:hypothetical protein